MTNFEPRFPADLPVMVAGRDAKGHPFKQSAKVVNISQRGGRLSGLRCLGRPGGVVQITRGDYTADFLVVWISHNTGMAGVCCIDPVHYVWGRTPPRTPAGTAARGKKNCGMIGNLHHALRGCLSAVGFKS